MDDPHLLATLDQVREIIGPEVPAIRAKFFPALEETASGFIRHSPLLLLATVDRNGHPDVSPKGDGPGFVAIENDHTLLIPERKGNKLIYGLQNILATGAQAVICGNAGCTLQIQAQLKAAGNDIPVLHPVEVLAAGYGVADA